MKRKSRFNLKANLTKRRQLSGVQLSNLKCLLKLESQGLNNALSFSPPGVTVSLRKGAKQIYYDELRELTWGDVISLLVDEGYFLDH